METPALGCGGFGGAVRRHDDPLDCEDGVRLGEGGAGGEEAVVEGTEGIEVGGGRCAFERG